MWLACHKIKLNTEVPAHDTYNPQPVASITLCKQSVFVEHHTLFHPAD